MRFDTPTNKSKSSIYIRILMYITLVDLKCRLIFSTSLAHKIASTATKNAMCKYTLCQRRT